MVKGDIWEILKSIVRVGKVSSVDPKKCTARVLFEDKDELVSFDLSPLVPKTHKEKYYYVPDIDEQVLCLFLPNNIQQGYVLGSFYSEKFRDKTPFSEDEKELGKDRIKVVFEDGTWLQYDRKEHILTIDCTGKVIVKSAAEVEVTAKTVNIAADNINIQGNVSISGNLDTTGNIHALGTVVDDAGNTNHHSHP